MISKDEKSDEEKLNELIYERDRLYDIFTRAAHSRSGGVLKQICEIDKRICAIQNKMRGR